MENDKKTQVVKPWERQQKETPKQFEAFKIYRDLGDERSLSKVANQLNKSVTLMGRWSGWNSWVERCREWDNEQERLDLIEQRKDIKKMRKRHADVASAMVTAAAKGLKNILEHPECIKPSDVSKLMDTAAKIERLSRGDVGDVIETRDGGNSIPAVQIYIPDNNRSRDNDDFNDLDV